MFIRRIVVQNYKSIASCALQLGPLNFLVGPNGAGKSNFLDALRFVADSLSNSLDHALRERGGIGDVRRRSAGHPTHFGIRLEFEWGGRSRGWYGFRIGAKPQGAFEVQSEECHLSLGEFGLPKQVYFKVRSGLVVAASSEILPPAVADRLYLVNAAGTPEFRPAYDLLSRMGFYNLNPERIRELQPPDAGDLLARDGGNLASVLGQMEKTHPDAKALVEEYLSKVVPGVSGMDAKRIGPRESVEFRQQVGKTAHPWKFLAANMSDGTLRAAGLLTSLFQPLSVGRTKVPLVGIEEPEAALHPAATGVLIDALLDASRDTQIVVTSHSPELLDDERVSDQSIFAVVSEDGVTKIAPIDGAARAALKENLYSAGQLLRMGQLEPDRELLAAASQASLFEDE